MKKLNSTGFSLVETVLLIAIATIIAGVGLYVTKVGKSAGGNETKSNVTEVSNKRPSFSFKLPEGWREKKCSQKDKPTNPAYSLVFPISDKATGCHDSTNTIWIDTSSRASSHAPERCMTTKDIKKYNNTPQKHLVDYACKEILINGVRVITESGNWGGGTSVHYHFKSNTPISMSIDQNNSTGEYIENGVPAEELIYISEFKQIAKSVKFD